MTALSRKFVPGSVVGRLAALVAVAVACGPDAPEPEPEPAAVASRLELARARAREARSAGEADAVRFWERIVAQEQRLAVPAGVAPDAEVRALYERGRRRLDEAPVVVGYRSTDQEIVREALEALEGAVEREPWVAEYQYGAGYGWFQAQAFDRARARFETALALDPDHFGALQALGTIHLNAGSPERAIVLLERVVELRPEDANGHYVLGKCREELGRFEESEASYLRALELHPGLIEPYNRLGGVLLRVGRPAEGRRMLDEFLWWKEHEIALRGRAPVGPRGAPVLDALQSRLAGLSREAPEDARLAVAHARVLAALGRTDELEGELRRARRTAAGDPDVLLDIAREWERLGDRQRAAALLTRALRNAPDHLEARLALAALLATGGRAEAAREQYRAALRLSPGCQRASRALADEEPGP